MGLTKLHLEIANAAKPDLTRNVPFLIDSGAVYSAAPTELLEALGIRPVTDQEFHMWDGTKTVRKKGPALFKYKGKTASSDIIFGEEDDCTIVGALTLASLGLVLDPLRRVLRPLPAFLAWHLRY